jgi:hypothetical protein
VVKVTLTSNEQRATSNEQRATSNEQRATSNEQRMPFTPEQFFAVFARYNADMWPMQVVLNAVAILILAFLYSGREWASRQISKLLALLWAWMAVGYHFFHFSGINPAAWLFGALFLLGGFAFVWFGVVKDKIVFQRSAGARGIAGAVLVVFALVLYPAIGYLAGHRYPAAPTFGLPCPTTIFTLGMLLFAAHPVPRWVLVVPLLWAAVGSVAAFQLGVIEDLALLAASVVTVVVMLRWPAPERRISMGVVQR